MSNIVYSDLLVPLIARLDELASSASKDLNCERIYVSITQWESLYSLGAYPAPGPALEMRRHNISDTVCGVTVKEGNPLRLPDARLDPRTDQLHYVNSAAIVGYLGFPIVDPKGHVFGAVCSIDSTPRDWSHLEYAYLEKMAREVELTIQSALHTAEADLTSDTLRKTDDIIIALSLAGEIGTSVYDNNFELVFSNREISSVLNLNYVTNFMKSTELQEQLRLGCKRGNTRSNSPVVRFDVLAPNNSGAKTWFNVQCSETANEFFVCRWTKQNRYLN